MRSGREFRNALLSCYMSRFPPPPAPPQPYEKFLMLPKALENLYVINFSMESLCFGSLTRSLVQSLRATKQSEQTANLSVRHCGMVRSSLCSWRFLRSGPPFMLLRKMVFTLWEKALKEKSNIMSGWFSIFVCIDITWESC